MATRLQLRADAASEPMPNAKQSADAINRDVATAVATYANPAKMLVAAGSDTQENSSTAAEPGSAHYTHYGSWISEPLAVQALSGTVTIALVMAEGNVSANANPRVKIFKWVANDTFGSDILALVTSGTELPAAYPAAPIVYFSAQAITNTNFASGDRIAIEVETYDNNTKTAAYLHGIRFGGADSGGYGGYVEFSADIQWPVSAITKIESSAVGLSDGSLRRGWAKWPAAETVGLPEAPIRRLWSVRSLAEIAGIADSPLKRAWSLRAMVEALGLADVPLRLGKAIRVVDEVMSLVEGWAKSTFTTIVKLTSETLGITDSALRRAFAAKELAESITVGEIVSRSAGFVRLIVEAVGVLEAFSRIAGFVKTIGEVVSISDVSAKLLWTVRQLIETVNVLEAKVRRAWAVRLKVEVLALQERGFRLMATVRQIVESLGISETKGRIAGLVKWASEVVGLSEVLVRVAGIVRVMIELVGMIDSAVRRMISTVVSITYGGDVIGKIRNGLAIRVSLSADEVTGTIVEGDDGMS